MGFSLVWTLEGSVVTRKEITEGEGGEKPLVGEGRERGVISLLDP